jgi:hypothetical protein
MADTKISALPASTTPLAGTEVLPIVQSGATVKVSVANLTAGRVISANGVAFPATASTSSDPNTLDDYEEGTFNPTAFGETTAGTTTYSFQRGQYTKVGNMVTCTIGVGVTNMTGTGKLLFGGLPFTMSSTYMDAYSGYIGKVSNLTFLGQLGLMPLGGGTTVRVIYIISGVGYDQVNVDTAFEFYYTFSYFV